MTAQAPRRPPYWTVVAFAVLLLLPPAWAGGLLIAAAAGVMVRAGVIRRSAARAGARAAARADGMLLGVDGGGRAVELSDQQLSAHGLILGASGAGKSTTLLRILTDQIGRGRPVIAIDVKGSPAFARRLAEAAAAAGRPFRIWTPDGPGHWNPLAHGNATELKDKLIATERFTEPHYQRAAERYVQTVLRVLAATHPERAPTLDEVVNLMDPARLRGALRAVPDPLREQVQAYLAGLTPDQHSAVRGLAARLAIITESDSGRYLAPPAATASTATAGAVTTAATTPAGAPASIDIRQALNGHEVVLFSLNSSKYGKLAAQLGTLVVQDLIAAAGHRLEHSAPGRAPPVATIGIDEFSALGADHVVALLARGREAGLSVLVATQELADLDRAAPGLRDQVLGNTAVKIAHRQDVPASAQTVAQMAGTKKVWQETRQFGGRLLGGYDTGRGTRRQVEEFLVHPNEIKSLRTGDAIVISKTPRARTESVRVAAARARTENVRAAPPRHQRDAGGREL